MKTSRETVGTCSLSDQAIITLVKEDDWVYPTIALITGNGEAADIALQHTPSHKLRKIGQWFLEMADKLEGNPIPADEVILEEAGHLSFTAWLAETKHLRERVKDLEKDV